MAWWNVGIGMASIAISAVGTGLSYFSQQQQANNAQATANYNAQIAAQNNKINLAMARQQADWNARYAEAQAQAQQNNATALEQQGRAAEAQGREQERRAREENEKQLAMQRARYAKAGVTSEGSPLQVMVESAALLELGVQDLHYQSNLEGMAYDRKAALERFQAGGSLFDAGIARYEGAAAEAGFQIQSNKAKADYLSGMSTADGYRAASYGTLVSGAGQAFQLAGNQYSRLDFSTTPGGRYNALAPVRRARSV